MGTIVSLTAADGFKLNAYRADPVGPARGGIVVIQEIFGVNHHIRSICDRLAAAGYRAMAPQVFDRLQPNFECGYSDAEVAKAREFIARIDWAKMMLDASAAVDALKRDGPVAIIGFCMGGTVAFMAATRLGGLTAAVGYYGGQIVRFADNKPRCPTQLHFGEKDANIPLSDVETIRTKRPECEIHIYPGAGHGFHCDERKSYEPNSAKLAWQRAMTFLANAFGALKPKQSAVTAMLTTVIKARPATTSKKQAKVKSKSKRKDAKSKAKKKSKTKAKRKIKPRRR
jgi:carboxymethylenebutenolidase